LQNLPVAGPSVAAVSVPRKYARSLFFERRDGRLQTATPAVEGWGVFDTWCLTIDVSGLPGRTRTRSRVGLAAELESSGQYPPHLALSDVGRLGEKLTFLYNDSCTFSCNTIADDAGRVTGLLCAVTEETGRLTTRYNAIETSRNRQLWRFLTVTH
jgi:hypothetical protein